MVGGGKKVNTGSSVSSARRGKRREKSALVVEKDLSGRLEVEHMSVVADTLQIRQGKERDGSSAEKRHLSLGRWWSLAGSTGE